MAEQQAHTSSSEQSRHWVRLTRVCNNRCRFCLDRPLQDGSVIPYGDILLDLERGRESGCERAVLSGGEATIHPRYHDIVRAARDMGYARVQTITNGRMFAYRQFLERALDAGLGELTFSLHGHTPALHDALTHTPGSFAQNAHRAAQRPGVPRSHREHRHCLKPEKYRLTAGYHFILPGPGRARVRPAARHAITATRGKTGAKSCTTLNRPCHTWSGQYHPGAPRGRIRLDQPISRAPAAQTS